MKLTEYKALARAMNDAARLKIRLDAARPKHLEQRECMVCADCAVWHANGDATGMGEVAYARIVDGEALLDMWPVDVPGDFWRIEIKGGVDAEEFEQGECGGCGVRGFGPAYHAHAVHQRGDICGS